MTSAPQSAESLNKTLGGLDRIMSAPSSAVT